MKPLPSTFTAKGFDHQLVQRQGNLAIYRRNRTGSARAHFEVIRVQHHNGFTLAGVSIPPAETYPTATQWGTNGWTCPDMDSAQRRLALCAARINA